MRIADLIAQGVDELKHAGVADSVTDVHLLLCYCLNKSRTQLLLAARDEIDEQCQERFRALLSRRIKREPLAYILGVQEFWSREFIVNPSVLIPRPETEFMLEMVFNQVEMAGGLPDGRVVDLCCGSGVIAIILALELHKEVTAIDLSGKAIGVAKENSRKNGTEELVRFIQSDLFTSLKPQQNCSLIVSNPPYVSHHSVKNELEPEVSKHEPWLALDGGERGLEIIRRIRTELPKMLMDDGLFFMEMGYDQGQEVLEMFTSSPGNRRDFQEVRILQDYSGRDRVLYARK